MAAAIVVVSLLATAAASTTGEPTTGLPTTGGPTTGDPAVWFPGTGRPTTGEPTTGRPTTGAPSTPAPPTARPATLAPGAAPGSTAVPNTAAPPTWVPGTTLAPPTALPSTGRPSTGEPSTGYPSLFVKTTGIPTTGRPETGVPNSAAPPTAWPRALEVPRTAAPVTRGPVTEHPGSAAPMTEAPASPGGVPATRAPATPTPVPASVPTPTDATAPTGATAGPGTPLLPTPTPGVAGGAATDAPLVRTEEPARSPVPASTVAPAATTTGAPGSAASSPPASSAPSASTAPGMWTTPTPTRAPRTARPAGIAMTASPVRGVGGLPMTTVPGAREPPTAVGGSGRATGAPEEGGPGGPAVGAGADGYAPRRDDVRIHHVFRELGDEASAIVAFVVAASGGPQSAAAITSLAAVSAGCEWRGPGDTFPVILHPTRITLAGDSAFGAAFASLIIPCVALLLALAAGECIHLVNQRPAGLDRSGRVYAPGTVWLVYMWVYQGGALGAAVMMHRGTAYDVVIALLVLAVHVTAAVVCGCKVRQYVPTHTIYREDLERTAPAVSWSCGLGEWVDCNIKTAAGGIVTNARKRYFWVIRSFTERRAWFGCADALWMIVIAFLVATLPSEFIPCAHLQLALAFVCLVRLAIIAYFQPYAKQREAWAQLAVWGLLVLSCVLVALGYYNETNEMWVFDVGFACVVAAVVILVASGALDFVGELYVVSGGGRSRLQAEEAPQYYGPFPISDEEGATPVSRVEDTTVPGQGRRVFGGGVQLHPQEEARLRKAESLQTWRTRSSLSWGGEAVSADLCARASPTPVDDDRGAPGWHGTRSPEDQGISPGGAQLPSHAVLSARRASSSLNPFLRGMRSGSVDSSVGAWRGHRRQAAGSPPPPHRRQSSTEPPPPTPLLALPRTASPALLGTDGAPAASVPPPTVVQLVEVSGSPGTSSVPPSSTGPYLA